MDGRRRNGKGGGGGGVRAGSPGRGGCVVRADRGRTRGRWRWTAPTGARVGRITKVVLLSVPESRGTKDGPPPPGPRHCAVLRVSGGKELEGWWGHWSGAF